MSDEVYKLKIELEVSHKFKGVANSVLNRILDKAEEIKAIRQILHPNTPIVIEHRFTEPSLMSSETKIVFKSDAKVKKK